MAEKLDPNALVTLDELALSTMWETSALPSVRREGFAFGAEFVISRRYLVPWVPVRVEPAGELEPCPLGPPRVDAPERSAAQQNVADHHQDEHGPQAASRHSDDPESAAQASLSSPPALRAPVGDALRHD